MLLVEQQQKQNQQHAMSARGRTDNCAVQMKDNTDEGEYELMRVANTAGRTKGTSCSDNMSLAVFRDFFLAAFSDGYQNTCLCGESGLPACCESSKAGGKGVSDESTFNSTRSTNSHSNASNSPSHDIRRRRKKPLAVAVGFKYAEDPNGRPIVVTPTGSRSSPIDLTGVDNRSNRHSPPRSPPQQLRSAVAVPFGMHPHSVQQPRIIPNAHYSHQMLLNPPPSQIQSSSLPVSD